MDRLTEANYVDIHSYNYSSHGWTQQYKTDNKYQEKVSYDLRGNITALERNGLTSNCMTYNGFVGGLWGKIDNLTYNYDPADLNKLLKVTDAADLTRGFKSVNNNSTYTYDANGNLTSDLNKNITGITYNYLNLPLVISFTGNNRIEFIYDATGAKLRKTIFANNVLQAQDTRDYVNGVEYKGGVVDRFAHTEGAVVRQADGTTFLHEYSIKDHLGNTRVTYRDDNTTDSPLGTIKVGEITQINHYYPFGMNMEGNWNGAAGSNKYQYNGKEWNDDFGLGLNDYGARFYDPAIARWTAVDPLGELRANVTPYQYVQNNPINAIDPTGMLDEKGADGMTNSQWMSASNPANRGSDAASSAYRGLATGQANYEKSRAEAEHRAKDGASRDVTGDDFAASFTSFKKIDYVFGNSEWEGDCECNCPGKPPCPFYRTYLTQPISGFTNSSPWYGNFATPLGLAAGALQLNLKNQELQRINSFNNMRAPWAFQVGENTKSLVKWGKYSTLGRMTGNMLGVYGFVTTFADVIEGKKSVSRGLLDVAFLYGGTKGGWWGVGLSTFYFGITGYYDYKNPDAPFLSGK